MWRDEACLLDMLLAARKIRQFSEGVAFERFLSDELMQHVGCGAGRDPALIPLLEPLVPSAEEEEKP